MHALTTGRVSALPQERTYRESQRRGALAGRTATTAVSWIHAAGIAAKCAMSGGKWRLKRDLTNIAAKRAMSGSVHHLGFEIYVDCGYAHDEWLHRASEHLGPWRGAARRSEIRRQKRSVVVDVAELGRADRALKDLAVDVFEGAVSD